MKYIIILSLIFVCACEKSEPQKKIEGKYYNEADRYLRKPIDQANEVNKINQKRNKQAQNYLDSSE